MVGLDAICDVGSVAGTRDGSVSAWVQVCVVPVGAATPDAWGRFLHVVVEFVQPQEWVGKRRRQAPATSDGPGTLQVECDPGTYWIGTWARFWLTGGTPGDKYSVSMSTATMQQESDARLVRGDFPFQQVDVFEPACQFQLTQLSTASDDQLAVPGPALNHSLLWLVQPGGGATWGGAPLTTVGWHNRVPLCAPVTTGRDTIYRTGGAV